MSDKSIRQLSKDFAEAYHLSSMSEPTVDSFLSSIREVFEGIKEKKLFDPHNTLDPMGMLEIGRINRNKGIQACIEKCR